MGLTIAIRRNLRCSKYTKDAVGSVHTSNSLHTNEPPSASSKSAVKACAPQHTAIPGETAIELLGIFDLAI